MAVGLGRVHRLWIALATMLSAMLATVGASAHEPSGERGSTVACHVPGLFSGSSAESLVLDKGRITTTHQLTGRAKARPCSRPFADLFADPHAPVRGHASRVEHGVQHRIPRRVAAVCRVAGAPLAGESVARPGRRTRMRFDETGAGDCADEDDDTVLPIRAWLFFQDMLRYAHDVTVPDDDSRSASIDTPSVHTASFQQLRC
jgi:hypothetical protein